MMKKYLLSMLILFFLLIFQSKAQNTLSFISATSGAATQEVCYFNDYLYIGAGSTLMVFDVTQGETPPYNKVFEYRFLSTIMDIVVHNGYLYIAANHDGISKWDISNPGSPQPVAEYIPDNSGEAAYDLSFYGDSLIVDYKNTVAIFHDTGSDLILQNTFFSPTYGGIIRGGEVIDSLYIFAVAMNTFSNGDGIYIYNLKNLNRLSYFHQGFGDPQDIILGNNNIVHVLGGSQSINNPFSSSGYFYSLDITDVYNPNMIFNDTIKGIPLLSIADAMNGINVNDTIYVATAGGINPSEPNHGSIYVYDATAPSDIHRIKYLNAGLWHFDVDFNVQNRKLYVASEWYGVKTLDLTHFDNYTDMGNTLTGGWNTGSDAKDSILIVANEGYGFSKYNISNISSPVLTGVNHDNGFCLHTKILDNGYIVGFYTSGDGIRVFDPSSLKQVSSLSINRNFLNIKKYGNKIFTVYNDFLVLINFNNPNNPVIENKVKLSQFADMDVNNQSKVFITQANSLTIYDGGNNLKEIASIDIGNQAGSITVNDDTIWAYFANLELLKLQLGFSGDKYQLIVSDTFKMPFSQNPNFLANDKYGIYAAYKTKGLYAFDKTNLSQTGYYKTGLEYWKNQFGVQDLFCVDDKIFLVEYHSQTSILANTDLSGDNPLVFDKKFANIFPNPTNGNFSIIHNFDKYPVEITIFGLNGRKLYYKSYNRIKNIMLQNPIKEKGVFLIKIEANGHSLIKKLIVN